MLVCTFSVLLIYSCRLDVVSRHDCRVILISFENVTSHFLFLFQRSWSIRSHNKNIEKLRKKLMEMVRSTRKKSAHVLSKHVLPFISLLFKQEVRLLINSPHLHFRFKNGRNGKTYVLLMSSDYERTGWRDTITALKPKGQGDPQSRIPLLHKVC